MKQAEFVRDVNSMIGEGVSFVVATVLRSDGPALVRAGSKVLISADGEVLGGTLGEGIPESAIAGMAKNSLGTKTPEVVKVILDGPGGNPRAGAGEGSESEIHVKSDRGGILEIYLEPFFPQERLILIGQGGKDDVEEALVHLGKGLEFEVVVVDHSPVLSERPDRLILDPDFALESLRFRNSDSVVVLTKGGRDVEIMKTLSKFNPRYVGLLASTQRVKDDVAKLRTEGVQETFLSSLRAPIGADIGAVTPGEIALSIMAEIVATKYSKKLPHKPSPT